MKQFVLIFIVQLIFSNIILAQSKEIDSVIETDLTKKEIFEKLENWSSNYFSNGDGKVALSDLEQGIIEASGSFPVTYKWLSTTEDGGIVKYRMRLLIKDGKYRIILSDFIHEATAVVKHNDGGNLLDVKPDKGSQLFGKTWRSYQSQTDQYKAELVNAVKKNFEEINSNW